MLMSGVNVTVSVCLHYGVVTTMSPVTICHCALEPFSHFAHSLPPSLWVSTSLFSVSLDFCFLIGSCCEACRILISQPGIKPGPLAVRPHVLTTGLLGNSLFCFLDCTYKWRHRAFVFISLSIPSACIHVVANGKISFFLWLSSSSLYIYSGSPS